VDVGCLLDAPSCEQKAACKEYKLPLLSGSPLGATLPLIKAQSLQSQVLLPDIRLAWENIAEGIAGVVLCNDKSYRGYLNKFH